MGGNYQLTLTNTLRANPTSIMYIRGISGEPKKIPPDGKIYDIAIEPDGILYMWLMPGGEPPGELVLMLGEENKTPFSSMGDHTFQVIRKFGIPPGAPPGATPTVMWIISWADFSPKTNDSEGPVVRQHVNVTVSDPQTYG
ncbi:MAG: hypothetical protein PVH61_29895 [Candidatus Aminicenantes bacterium]|jgi:hypothetical protein